MVPLYNENLNFMANKSKPSLDDLKKEKNELLRRVQTINAIIKKEYPDEIKSGKRVSDIKVLETIRESKTVREVIDKLNMNKGGSTYIRVRRIAEENGITLARR